MTADVKKPSETGYAVSADGKTVLKSTGEVVSIREVASVKNGKMTLRLEDGSEVSSEDVSYASRDEALVYETIANMGVNASEANVLVNAFHTGNVDADTYTLGIQEAYRYGKYNYTVQEMLDRGSFASMLTEHQRKTAYKLGQVFSGRETAKAQAEVRSKQTDSAKNANSKKDSNAKKGGVMYESRDGSVSDLDSYLKDSGKELKPIQKTAIQTMKMLSDVFGIKFYVFESYINSEGKRVWKDSSGKEHSINGYYDQSDGSIHIDLNAGVDGKGTMLFTMAHELTHFIKQWSPAKFKVLANFLMKQYGEKGVSVDALVRKRMKKTGLGYDAAYEEVVANSMESMLSDGNVTEKLAELKKQDRGLWNKIRQFINSWVDKLRAAYKGLTPDSEEGQTVYEMKDAAERLQALFAEALADAGENYQAAGKQKNTANDSDVNELFYGDVKYSERVTDKETLEFLDKQDTITTYKTMQIVDGKLYPPMASRIDGKYEDYSELGVWEQATEHPELIKENGKFKLDKGKGQGSIEAAYNPYMHSSNLVLNDQFSGAYSRDNLVTVECEVPVSEETSGYHAQYAKDSVGWHPWHTGTVAGSIRKAKGVERQVFLSRWIKPVRIVPDSEVASMYKDLLSGTDVAVPDNVVTPSLLKELKKAGVKIEKSGRVNYNDSNSKDNPYIGKNLSLDSEVYNYSFMTALDPMTVAAMPPLSSVKVNGRISQDEAVSLGLKNSKSIGREIGKDQYAIMNAYTEREIVVGKNGLNHSLGGDDIKRLRTNARLSSIGGEIVRNAIPIDGLKNKRFYNKCWGQAVSLAPKLIIKG